MHVADKLDTTRPELSAPDECARVPYKGRCALDILKGSTVVTFPKTSTIFSQGEAADALFYIEAGKVKLSVVSPQGKEAVVALLDRGAFLGESCLAGQPVRRATAAVLEDSTLVRVDKDEMIRALQEESGVAELFMSYLLTRTMRLQEDVVDQLFNSSEKRLARVLLSLAHIEDDGKPEAVIPQFSQENFAEMIGTTRSRVSFFMNRFRKLGYIDYTVHKGEVHVRSALLNVLHHD